MPQASAISLTDRATRVLAREHGIRQWLDIGPRCGSALRRTSPASSTAWTLLEPGVAAGHRRHPDAAEGDAPTDAEEGDAPADAEVSLWTGVGIKP
ncbi:hypothetical protein ACFY64_05405 [Streptomyces collinus]|uniref:hypothetical protein n=1 Tax=Streptomyces collinus TaxID=42684 RepID=UPI0036CCDA5F